MSDIENRHLTIKEWWAWKVRHKGDPRVHYHPIKIQFYDAAAGLRDALLTTTPDSFTVEIAETLEIEWDTEDR